MLLQSLLNMQIYLLQASSMDIGSELETEDYHIIKYK